MNPVVKNSIVLRTEHKSPMEVDITDSGNSKTVANKVRMLFSTTG